MARLGARYPHRVFEARPRSQGIGIASRHPLAKGRVDMLGLRFLPAAVAVLRAPGYDLQVACIHLVPPQAGFVHSDDLWALYRKNKALQLRQVEFLLRGLDANAPAIVLGDMNEWPGQAAVAELAKAGFGDSCQAPASRCGPTWPGHTLNFPATFRIDYILGRGVRFADPAVLQAGGSDHYPVAARVMIEPRKFAEGTAQ